MGEMERDGLLSHGAAYVTMDRLLECSDKTYVPLCLLCGRTLGIYFTRMAENEDPYWRQWRCRVCESHGVSSSRLRSSNSVAQVAIPAVLRYLISELAACNISVRFNMSLISEDENFLR